MTAARRGYCPTVAYDRIGINPEKCYLINFDLLNDITFDLRLDITAAKRGYCPTVALDQMGICSEECSVDADCSGTEKCCSNGCGHTCQRARTSKPGECPAIDPDNIICFKQINPCETDMDCENIEKCCWTGCSPHCTKPASKPGDCPAIDPERIMCISQINPCETDMDCGSIEKCCWTGCSPYCTKPAPREGNCPAVASDIMGACVQECSEDHECDAPKKCCSNGCGKTCQNAEVPKPGICPAVEEGMMGICMESCSKDSECEGDHKCCSNGCGHACKPPAENSCFVNGKYYLSGSSVPDPHQCNSCFCAGGQLGCTEMACFCQENGQQYLMGQTFPKGDGCNNCTCIGDRGDYKSPCTDYICDKPQSPFSFTYMNKVAVVTACLGGVGLIITMVALVAAFCVYKGSNKRKGKVMSADQDHLVGADPLPPKA